jgi:hypothetical protein
MSKTNWIECPFKAVREFGSTIPVRGGGPAQRGEPDDWFPGAGELESIPEQGRRKGISLSSML